MRCNAFIVIVWCNEIVVQLRFNSATSNKYSINLDTHKTSIINLQIRKKNYLQYKEYSCGEKVWPFKVASHLLKAQSTM